jgi:hypothetical protein
MKWRRRLFVFCSCLSLVFCLAAAALWVRSYWRAEWVKFVHPPWQFSVASYPGRISFGVYHEVVPPRPASGDFGVPLTQYPRFSTWSQSNPPGTREGLHSYYLPQGVPMYRALGFVAISHLPGNSPNLALSFMIPHACGCLLASILPVWWYIRHRRCRSSSPSPACRNCGYNLTGNVSGVCPECGEKTDAQVARKR